VWNRRYRRDSYSGPIDEALLRAMNDTMFHRGPDGHGLHLEPGAASTAIFFSSRLKNV
jgi:asparagine synthetase B (glutamine-hydrolysing)